MHIPDGFLSPETCILSYGLSLPFLYRGIKGVLEEESLAKLASLSALSFLVMMINIPIPGGTSGHALGTSLIAIVFGPWKAVASLSIVLAIQALLFADGGITTYGANLLTMGIVPAFVGFWMWRISPRRALGYFLSGYVSLLSSVLTAAIVLGIQPIFFSQGGQPLYFPYGLKTTLAAMGIPALLFFGPIEGVFNLAVLSFLLKDEKGV